MKVFKQILLILVVALISVYGTYLYINKQAAAVPAAPKEPDPIVKVDEMANWMTISPGGVIEMKIPKGCASEGAAGSTYVSCSENGGAPVSSAVISSDGMTVNIRKGENTAWQNWDKFLSSLKVITPLSRSIEISIEQ